jgi:hypothetical protein
LIRCNTKDKGKVDLPNINYGYELYRTSLW